MVTCNRLSVPIVNMTTVTPAQDLFPCREDFFREEGSEICVPSCETWHEFSDAEVIATDVVIGLAAGIGFLSGVAVITISFIRFKRMYEK